MAGLSRRALAFSLSIWLGALFLSHPAFPLACPACFCGALSIVSRLGRCFSLLYLHGGNALAGTSPFSALSPPLPPPLQPSPFS